MVKQHGHQPDHGPGQPQQRHSKAPTCVVNLPSLQVPAPPSPAGQHSLLLQMSSAQSSPHTKMQLQSNERLTNNQQQLLHCMHCWSCTASKGERSSTAEWGLARPLHQSSQQPCSALSLRLTTTQHSVCQPGSLNSTSASDLTIAEVAVRVELVAHKEGPYVSPPHLYRLAPLQQHHWQPSLCHLQGCKQACWAAARQNTWTGTRVPSAECSHTLLFADLLLA